MDRATLADLHFRLIEQFAPPSIIIDADHEVVHVSEHACEFLKFSGGEPTINLLRVVLPALRVELRTALFRASESKETVESVGLPVEIDGKSYLVDLHRAGTRDRPWILPRDT